MGDGVAVVTVFIAPFSLTFGIGLGLSVVEEEDDDDEKGEELWISSSSSSSSTEYLGSKPEDSVDTKFGFQ